MNEDVLRPVELEAYGLLLRPWEETSGDLDAALRGLADPDFRRWNTAHAPEPDEAGVRAFLRRRRDGWGPATSRRSPSPRPVWCSARPG